MSIDEVLEPGRTALIVWDMQVGVAARAHDLPLLRETFDELLDAARSNGVRVIWSRHVAPPIGHTAPAAIRSMMIQQAVQDPSELRLLYQAGTPETELLQGLVPLAGELVIEKSTISFFIGTPLELRLRAHGITTLVLTGVATEAGIEFTARHALALGLFVVVAEDAVGGFTAEAHKAALARLRSAADILPSAAIIAAWSRSVAHG